MDWVRQKVSTNNRCRLSILYLIPDLVLLGLYRRPGQVLGI